MSARVAVEVEDLTRHYGSFVAVDGISFDIAEGETFALLGPNGAGKSTTIEILEGYRDRTSGRVAGGGGAPPPRHHPGKARRGVGLGS